MNANDELRHQIKVSVDELPPDRLTSLVDFLLHLKRPTLKERIAEGLVEAKEGRTRNWRESRRDV